jgi:hypothetical protein
MDDDDPSRIYVRAAHAIKASTSGKVGHLDIASRISDFGQGEPSYERWTGAKVLHKWPMPQSTVTKLVASESFLALANKDGEVRLYSLVKRELLSVTQVAEAYDEGDPVTTLLISRDERYIIVSAGSFANVWAVGTNPMTRVGSLNMVDPHRTWLYQPRICLMPDDNVLVSSISNDDNDGDDESKLLLCKLPDLRVFKTLTKPGFITAMVASASSKYVFLQTLGGMAAVYDVKPGADGLSKLVRNQTQSYTSTDTYFATFSPNEERYAFSMSKGADTNIFVWNMAEPVRHVGRTDVFITPMRFNDAVSAHGMFCFVGNNLLASFSPYHHYVTLFDTRSGEQTRLLSVGFGRALVYANNRLYVAAMDKDDACWIYEMSPWFHKEAKPVPRLPMSKTLAGFNVYEMD